jgi:hypothetical protein
LQCDKDFTVSFFLVPLFVLSQLAHPRQIRFSYSFDNDVFRGPPTGWLGSWSSRAPPSFS